MKASVLPFDLFISYSHSDNRRDQVRELRDAIKEDFESFAGRTLTVFFDEDDIPSMAAWERRIAKGLRESRLFLAVLSPSYFASVYCRREWEEYVRYEAMRQCLGEGVAPVYFVELPGLATGDVDERIAEWVAEARKHRQWCDLASQAPIRIARWHDEGRRALEDAHVAERLRVLQNELTERLDRADRGERSPTNIYRHNPQFVGRVRELTLLREALNERGSVGVVGQSAQSDAGAIAVHGLGGMGKTELALAYSHAFAWDYPGGRWMAACEHVSDFNLVLRQLAEPLGVEFTEEENKDASLAGERILAELRRRDRSLLLLDNVGDPALIAPEVLMRLPPQGHVHVLATTRMGPAQLAGSPHDHTFVAVDELPADDALALIRSHQPGARFTGEDDESAARELVELLDGFTLAVETAAIYLGRHAKPGVIADYTRRLGEELLGESERAAGDPTVAVRHREALLERTLAITFETLSAEQIHVLSLGSLLPADQIPLPWLRAVDVEGAPTFELSAEGDTAWNQLAESLLSLRLVQAGDDKHIVRMHRLVQELIRKRTKGKRSVLDASVIEYVKSRAQCLWEEWVDLERRWEVAPLAACAWHWMGRGDGAGSYLAHQVSGPLKGLAKFVEAEPLMRRTLEFRELNYGPDHPDIAPALNNLAQLLASTNRINESERLMRRALANWELNYGPYHPDVASALNNLALLLKDTNRLEEAELMYRRALAINESCYSSEHRSLVPTLNNLASLLEDTNRLDEAEPLIRRALAISESSYGPHHPETATTLNNLASLLHDTSRSGEAELLYRRALAVDEACFGPRHPTVATRLGNLASLLQGTNRPDEAEPLIRRALAIDEVAFGPNHPTVGLRLNNLAMLLQHMNRLEEAEPLMRQSLTIFERSQGPDHPRVADSLNNLASLLKDMSRPNEAETLRRRALAINESCYGAEHPGLISTLNNLASLLQGTNRLDEAEPLMRRALAISEASYGPHHPTVAITLNNLAGLLRSTNRLSEAEPLMTRMIEIFLVLAQRTGHPHPNLGAALENYAVFLRAIGRSEAMIQQTLNDLLREHGQPLGSWGPPNPEDPPPIPRSVR